MLTRDFWVATVSSHLFFVQLIRFALTNQISFFSFHYQLKTLIKQLQYWILRKDIAYSDHVYA